MFTCIATFAGFLLVLGIGGLIADWLDRLTSGLPINQETTTQDD